MLAHKYDFAVLWRLTRLLRRRRIDAVVTVGTGGDKMFWGRLAGWLAGVPVICSALHSTGLPDHVELPNRLLAPLTDAFIAVAEPHASLPGGPRRLSRRRRFASFPTAWTLSGFIRAGPTRRCKRNSTWTPAAPVVGIVAALRPEKNHEMFLDVAAAVHRGLPTARFLVVGDGPQRTRLRSAGPGTGNRRGRRVSWARAATCRRCWRSWTCCC